MALYVFIVLLLMLYSIVFIFINARKVALDAGDIRFLRVMKFVALLVAIATVFQALLIINSKV